MNQYVPFNINDEIKVKLTDKGRAVYESYWMAVLAGSNGLQPPSLNKWTDENGWTSFQLWDAMTIFGPHCYNGGPLMFENNTILFPVPPYYTYTSNHE
jgi:hypothetical protein